MKNIFEETDVLLRDYGAVQLTDNDLLLYEHNKKSYIAGFLYFITDLNSRGINLKVSHKIKQN